MQQLQLDLTLTPAEGPAVSVTVRVGPGVTKATPRDEHRRVIDTTGETLAEVVPLRRVG